MAIKIFYTPSHEWLLYDKYNKNVTKHSFVLKFLSVGKWAGRGRLGNTVNIDVSTVPQEALDEF